MYKKIQLDNGLRIILNRMPRMQSVALGIWIGVGGRYENEKNKGISHFLEHILFKGTKRFSIKETKELIEGKGGSLNAFTAEEVTCYLCKVLPKNLPLSLDILSDMVLNPTIPADEVEKERLVILEEIKMYKDLPQHHVHELLDNIIWPGHPLGTNLAGSHESVSAITRDDLSNFQQGNYHPRNIVVVVSGFFDRDEIVDKIKNSFLKAAQKETSSFLPVGKQAKKREFSFLFKETEQSHLAMGICGLKREHRDRYALGLLHVILGANMSSRLFNKVREERGLCYSIRSHVRGLHDTGAFYVSAGMDNRKVKEAIEVILQELSLIRKELVTEDEFTRAKDFSIGQLSMALDDTLDHMLWIGEPVICEGKTHTLKQIIKKIDVLTREDLKRVAEKVLDLDNLKVALIGPLKEEHQQSIQDLIQK